MSNTSSVVYDRTSTATPLVVLAAAALAISLGVGAAIGYAISNSRDAAGVPQSQVSHSAAHEQFLRMNTQDLDHLVPMITSTGAAAAVNGLDAFITLNVDTYAGLNSALESRQAIGERLSEMNALWTSPPTVPAISQEFGSPVLTNSEPFGHPNYGRLESYVGAPEPGGVR